MYFTSMYLADTNVRKNEVHKMSQVRSRQTLCSVGISTTCLV